MANTLNVQEGVGGKPGSPLSPTRPASLRKRQSLQIVDLETRVETLAAENRQLQEAKIRAEQALQNAAYQKDVDRQLNSEAVEARDRELTIKNAELAQLQEALRALQEEYSKLTESHSQLTEANKNLTADTNERYATLQAEGATATQQLQESQRALEELRTQHSQLNVNMEDVVRTEIAAALAERNAEIERLQDELEAATEQIKTLKRQILASKQGDSFLTARDEDYFDSACQQLCSHVQQWVLRFSKYSDKFACRLSSELRNEKLEARLDNAVLDGSDVDMLLADRQKRRDIFMSVVMTMIWEYVFTRYLFGMDREQRQKLKSLEKTLQDVGK
jgi:chromosome segregation ATPase